MDRVPGHAWLMVLAAAFSSLVASAVPLAPAELRQFSQGPSPPIRDLRRVLCRVAGAGALVVTGAPAAAVLLPAAALHPLLDRRLAARLGVDVPRGRPFATPTAGAARLRRVAVPRHPQRAVLRHQRRRLSGAAADAPRLRAHAARRPAVVRAGAAGARRVVGVRARPRPHCRRAGGRRRRPRAPRCGNRACSAPPSSASRCC